jgi:mono/diheme cytochrome c family protein
VAALAAPAALFGAAVANAGDDGVTLPPYASTPDTPAGERVYRKWCSHCHDPGIGHPGTQAIEAKYKGKRPGVLTEWTELNPEYVELMVRQGISVMPQFRKTEISDEELRALAEWMAAQGKPTSAPR